MKQVNSCLIFTVLFVFSVTAAFSQKSYLKYDGNNRPTGLFNLKGDATGCKNNQNFAGTIAKWSSDINGASDETFNQYYLTLALTGGKRKNFYFALSDEVNEKDVQKIVKKNNRVTIKAALCQGGVWQARELTLGNKL